LYSYQEVSSIGKPKLHYVAVNGRSKKITGSIPKVNYFPLIIGVVIVVALIFAMPIVIAIVFLMYTILGLLFILRINLITPVNSLIAKLFKHRKKVKKRWYKNQGKRKQINYNNKETKVVNQNVQKNDINITNK
jgi:hypothetical protein